jgi:predicted DNA-binding protein (MmcQ/YjbR family)
MPSWSDLEAFCLRWPGAWADDPWNDGTVFKVGQRIFAMPSRPDAPLLTVTCKVSPELREALRDHPAVFVPAYVGRFGWIGIRITDATSWEMAETAIEESYRLVAPRRRSPKRG